MSDSTLDTSEFSEGPPALHNYMDSTQENPEFLAPMARSKQPLETNVYYHLNNEMYNTKIPVPPQSFTLSHLKCILGRTNIQCYIKKMDENVQTEVKVQILDDTQVIEPNEKGQYILYLLNTDENFQSSTLQRRKKRNQAPVNRPVLAQSRKQNQQHMVRQSSVHRRRPQPIATYSESSSEESCNFTSISAQLEPEYQNPHRRLRQQRERGRRHWSPSFMSTTMETDMSVSVNLITVPLNFCTDLPFGMSVIWRENGSSPVLTVSKIQKGGLVALDGRIKEGLIIVEVNNIPMCDYTGEKAVKVLMDAVDKATISKGQLKLTLCEPLDRRPLFQLPDESIHPIDTNEWVKTVAYARGMIDQEIPIQPVNGYTRNTANTWPSSGVGSSIGSSVHGTPKQFTINTPHQQLVSAMLDHRYGVTRSTANRGTLNIKDCFLGQDIINWLSDNVIGIDDHETAARFAELLVSNKFIIHVSEIGSFNRNAYYTVNWERLPKSEPNTLRRGMVDIMERPIMDDTLPVKKKNCFTKLLCLPQKHKKK